MPHEIRFFGTLSEIGDPYEGEFGFEMRCPKDLSDAECKHLLTKQHNDVLAFINTTTPEYTKKNDRGATTGWYRNPRHIRIIVEDE